MEQICIYTNDDDVINDEETCDYTAVYVARRCVP